MAQSMKQMAQDFVKLECFNKGNFKRWQKKVHFILTTLKVVYVLTTPKLEIVEDETTAQARKRRKWDQDDYLCKGHILNAMTNELFDIYNNMESARALWTALEMKYLSENGGAKKFVVSHFLNFKMTDDKLVVDQIHEIQHIISQVHQQGVNLDDTIIIPSIIDRLPPYWKDFRKSLKHKKEEMSLEDLIQTLQVEEESRLRDKREDIEPLSSKVHVVENVNMTDTKPPNQPWKGNKKRKHQNGKGSDKNKKRKGASFQCGKMGHYKRECQSKKSNTQGNNEKFVALISEVDFLEGEDAWWIDSGAPKYVCKDRSAFLNYAPVEDGKVLYMGNSSTAEVKEKGKVELEFTSGKILTLTDVYHVPDVRKNLISGSLLNKNGFKLIFESNKFVLSKGGSFVGKGYMYEGMFKMNINKINVFVYMLESISLWHNRLGHINGFKPPIESSLEPQEETNEVPNEIRRSKRDRRERTLGPDFVIYLVEGSRNKTKTSTMIDLKVELDPKTYEEATKSQDVAFWKEAINDEMDSIVDDMLIFGSDMDNITRTKEFLSLNFDMKDMGVADVILGIRIVREGSNLIHSQSHYIEKVLRKFNHFDCTSVSTPFDSSLRLYPNTGRSISQLSYASAIGSLMYAMTCTRPDIAFAVGKLSRHTSNPSNLHWNAINRILKYLKGTIDYGLSYSGYPVVLEGYTDASWLTKHVDHSSTSGWIFTLGGRAICWASKWESYLLHNYFHHGSRVHCIGILL
ncbi:uncharacterized protein LOC143850616 [Tasmannia lanceolata]|uniref:uncharacterized protein LOC143850616 n=1 Tax=Tasmannia lanceolata TaxID=3420 RepID=UPI004064C827